MRIRAVHIKELLKTLAAFLFLAVFLLFPEPCTRAAKDGLNMAMYMVLPSLFPFAVISGYLAGRLKMPRSIRRIFKELTGLSDKACNVFVLGLLSGFPVGAVLTADAVKNKAFSVSCANHLLPLCTVCGPIFMIGVIGGGMLGSYKLGYVLYTIQLISLIIVCLFFKKSAPTVLMQKETPLPHTSLVGSIEKSVSNLLTVCGFIIFFQVICQMLITTGLAENLCPYPPLLYGITELSGGCSRIVFSDISLPLKAALLSFLCSFSGICVMLQIAHAVRDTQIRLKKYVLYKLCMGVISFAITLTVLRYFPVETFGAAVKSDTFSFSNPFLLFCYALFAFSALILFIKRKFKGHTFDNR